MAHKAQEQYCRTVKNQHPDHFKGQRVLEVGSLNVNGSFRTLFTDCDYTGIDIHPGKDVDLVIKGHEYTSKKKFGVVCSGECFEHDEYWQQTVDNMYRLLKKGGLFFFTCASTGRSEHGTKKSGHTIWGTSQDYYKNLTIEDFEEHWDLNKMFKDYELIYNEVDHDLYFKGIK